MTADSKQMTPTAASETIAHLVLQMGRHKATALAAFRRSEDAEAFARLLRLENKHDIGLCRAVFANDIWTPLDRPIGPPATPTP